MKKTRSILALLLCLVMLAGLMAGCGGEKAEEPAAEPAASEPAAQTPAEEPAAEEPAAESGEPKVLTVGADADSASLDPLLTSQTSWYFMAGACMGQLWWYDHQGNLVYNLGTGFEYADDLSSVTFHLREGVTFQNGNPFTASDVLYTLKRCIDSPQYAQRVACIDFDNSKVVDDYTLQLAFKQFEASFAASMSAPIYYMIDEEWGTEVGEEGIGTEVNAIGPYYLDDWSIGTSFTLKRNESYWGDAPYYDEIVIKFIPEESTRMMEFEVGTLDMAYITTAQNVKDLADGLYGDSYNYQVPLQSAGGIGFNMRDKADMWPKDLRLAIAHAIDAQTIVEVICGGIYAQATSIEPSANWGYLNTGIYEYDPELAKQYLASAGYADGFEFTVQTSDQAYNVPILEAIQAMLSDVGVTMNIETVDATVYRTMLVGGETVAGLSGYMGGGDPGDVMIPREKGSGNSLGEAPTEELAQLIVDAKAEPDQATRLDMYHQIQQIYHDECFFVPIYEQTYNFACSADLVFEDTDYDVCSVPRLGLFTGK